MQKTGQFMAKEIQGSAVYIAVQYDDGEGTTRARVAPKYVNSSPGLPGLASGMRVEVTFGKNAVGQLEVELVRVL